MNTTSLSRPAPEGVAVAPVAVAQGVAVIPAVKQLARAMGVREAGAETAAAATIAVPPGVAPVVAAAVRGRAVAAAVVALPRGAAALARAAAPAAVVRPVL